MNLGPVAWAETQDEPIRVALLDEIRGAIEVFAAESSAGEGDVGQGANQLSIYSDYNNTDHGLGNRIESNVFQEQTIGPDDVDELWTFAFDAKRGNIAGSSTATSLMVAPGEIIHLPDSGYDIGGGYDALVLYASEERITLKYTRDDNVVAGRSG